MLETIHGIVFPTDDFYDTCRELFFRGNAICDTSDGHICIAKYNTIDFTTYINSLSYGRYRKYTYLDAVAVRISIIGRARIIVKGYTLKAQDVSAVTLCTRDVEANEVTDVIVEIPETDCDIVGFEVQTLSDTEIYGGEYIGTYSETTDRSPIKLSVVMTTYHREEYVYKNLSDLRKQLYESTNGDVSEYIHIRVIDNGQTIPIEENSDEHITIYHNRNLGGSGGFARGMIESMRETDKSDYVLLLDDDVKIIPGCIAKIYRFLKHIKTEYNDSMISGAMLYMDARTVLHDDTGYVCGNGIQKPLKIRDDGTRIRRLDCANPDDLLYNEKDYPKIKNQYAGWWFCVIPGEAIERQGLPLPLFIKNDDVEYALRNHAHIITMNGVGVWHERFEKKYNALNEYHYRRNVLIGQACFGGYKDVDFMGIWKQAVRQELFRFHYKAAELIVQAVEDYLKGPEYLVSFDEERFIKSVREELPKPGLLKESNLTDINLSETYIDEPRRFTDKVLYHLTMNGHRFYPARKLGLYALIPEGYVITAQKQTLKRTLYAINPHTDEITRYDMDRNRYRYVWKKYKTVIKEYKKEHVTVEMKYRDKANTLASIENWKTMLGIV